ncbi:hypothetical protein AAF712_014741 [Marasmius tenuissimus]|uniref:Multidrug resistance-associated ABC transporter n=1 Tax=Marasmius tenuissimus TaxID=585030 RepID=A0ABR2ZCR7_9AGAR
MGICGHSGAFKLSDPCVRDSWATVVPLVFVFLLALFSIPIPKPAPVKKLIRILKSPFRSYLTLHEAEALDTAPAAGDEVAEDENRPRVEVEQVVSLWRTVVLVFVGLLEVMMWTITGSYKLVVDDSSTVWTSVRPLLVACVWIYAVMRPVIRPSVTAPLDLFVVYVLQLVSAVIQFGGALYGHAVLDMPAPSVTSIVGNAFNLAAIVVVLAVVFSMPLALPSKRVDKSEIGRSISPEDYTTVWGWATFSWVYPLVRRGRSATLNETDVWNLSPTFQSRPLFIKFSNIQRSTLLRRIWAANSLDLILDAIFTMTSSCLSYLNPFFLNHILSSIDKDPEPITAADRSNAYIFACLMLLSSLAKAESDVQHLWFGRRAATRIRSELMAAIYDKALKRKEYSGVLDKSKVETKPAEDAPKDKKSKKKEKEEKDKADEPKAGADVGKIVNLMAGDANIVCQAVTGLYLIYGSPLEIVLGCLYLYQLLGWSAFAGFAVLLAGWPLNTFLAKRSIRIQKGTMAARDKRMGVKFIKFFAWEERWIERVMGARGKEMKWMVKSRVNSIMFYTLWMSAPILVSIVSFAVYVAQGNELTVSQAFTAVALFGMIRAPLNVIPAWIVQILNTKVALDRIAVYLGEDEVDEQVSSLKKDLSEPQLPGSEEEQGLGLKAATLKWNEVEEKPKKDEQPKQKRGGAASNGTTVAGSSTESETGTIHSLTPSESERRFELRDATVVFPEGELTVVTGPTASGKTALLMAVLGEMTLLSGQIILSKNPRRVDAHGNMHTISYAAQTPWLRHQSIKDNILFGYPHDEQRYKAVVDACALKPDFDILEDGDATEIGARGVSLSGGQKARVALARAVYARTKYVLLDDPLSAVDSHTSRYLYENLLCGPLLANRTVVLVTHHVDLVVPGAHYLVRMLDGRIDTQGTPTKPKWKHIAEEVAVAEKEGKDKPAGGQEGEVEDPDADKKPRKLVKDEHRETGSVKWRIYQKYLEASSYYVWAILFVFVVMNQFLGVGEKVWMKPTHTTATQSQLTAPSRPSGTTGLSDHEYLAESYMTSQHHQLSIHSQLLYTVKKTGLFGIDWPDAHKQPLFYVGYMPPLVSPTCLSMFFLLLLSSRVNRQLLERIVRATFRFHDTTPSRSYAQPIRKGYRNHRYFVGRNTSSSQLLNGKLLRVCDNDCQRSSVSSTVSWRSDTSTLVVISAEWSRTPGLRSSPTLVNCWKESSPSRAFSAERQFLDNLHKKIDHTTQMWYSFWMTNRWLLLNFDSIGCFAVFITAMFSISREGEGVAGIAGICISSALSFTGSVYWACRFWTNLELDLNSVERVVEYLEVPQEAPAIIESNRPPAYWPSSSNNDSLISVEDLSVRYAPELPAVLQDVSFTLKAGERVGLLGRTGSGKSTLAMSILRFVDPSSGRIIIDGVDISKIGIHDLRSRLTFIPQDATLFSGTLRDNLDPFNEHSDAECLDVLYRVQVISQSQMVSRRSSRAPSAAASPATSRPPSIHEREDRETTLGSDESVTDIDTKGSLSLDTQVVAGGSNFSQGQRQLIAMARALLRRSSIIVLDEATSSIDFATDAKIQNTIREEFTDSLLLTVAHRLRTVIDYDRLIVLDKGRMVEFDTPLNLIHKQDGIFRNMCLKSGTYAELEATAVAKAERDRQNTRS